jgi:hypothetical protein
MNKTYKSRRTISELPKELQAVIHAMSFHKNNVYMEGSASYSVMKYPADVDLYEEVKYNNNTTEKCIKTIHSKLNEIVADLNNRMSTYVTGISIGDVKWMAENLKHNLTAFAHDIQEPHICKLDVITLVGEIYIESKILLYLQATEVWNFTGDVGGNSDQRACLSQT